MAFTYPLLAEVPRPGGDIPRSAASVTSVIYRGKKLALCWHKAFPHNEHSSFEERRRTMHTMSRGKIDLRWFTMVRFDVILINFLPWCFASSTMQSCFCLSRNIYIYIISKHLNIIYIVFYMYYPMVSSRNIPNKFRQQNLAANPGRFAGGKLGECDDVGFGSQCMVSLSSRYVDVSKNRGTPKWMVYNGKPY